MRAKLCDFGSARIWAGSDQDERKHIEFSNDYFGPYWTAPEQFTKPFVTGTEMMKGDIFSLGIVFWEMIMRKLLSAIARITESSHLNTPGVNGQKCRPLAVP